MAQDKGCVAIEEYKIPNEIEYDGMILNGSWITAERLERMKRMEATERDVLLTSYVRTGSTWMSEILFLILSNGDFETAKSLEHLEKLIFLELSPPWEETDPVERAKEKFGRERLLKTHMSVTYTENMIKSGKAKTIVVYRNPKDTLVSYYHFYVKKEGFGNYPGTWSDFFELFKRKKLCFGDWLEFYRGYGQLRNLPNVMFVSFEEMKNDTKSIISNVAKFLDKTLEEKVIDGICEYVSFGNLKESMKVDPNVIRKGNVGSWKDVFTVSQSEMLDELYAEEIQKLELPMVYDLGAASE